MELLRSTFFFFLRCTIDKRWKIRLIKRFFETYRSLQRERERETDREVGVKFHLIRRNFFAFYGFLMMDMAQVNVNWQAFLLDRFSATWVDVLRNDKFASSQECKPVWFVFFDLQEEFPSILWKKQEEKNGKEMEIWNSCIRIKKNNNNFLRLYVLIDHYRPRVDRE